MSQPPYPGQHPEQPHSGQPHQGEPHQPGQPYQAQPGQPDQPFDAPQPGQPYPAQPGQPFDARPGRPFQGQPYQGAPNPDVPQSVPPQPGFPPRSYDPPPSYTQPPAYGQPLEYGQQVGYQQQPGYPVYGQPTPPPRKSRALPITLISLAVVLVLCVGGGTAAFLLVRNTTENIAESLESAAPTPGATTEPTTDPTPTQQAKTITLVEPKKLGGRPRVTDEAVAGMADVMESQLSSLPDVTNSIGAFYGTPAKRDIVIIAGVEAPIADPQKALDDTFGYAASDHGLDSASFTHVEPGPLGGAAGCGKTKAGGLDGVLCGWADEGSFGWIMFYFKSIKQVRGEFVKLRGEIEKSS